MNKTVVGTGLIAVDLILNEGQVYPTNINILAGGSCGNVLSILAYLKWQSYPISQLSDNAASKFLFNDFQRWGVNTTYITVSKKSVTPVIIHRILQKNAQHKFEFKIPLTNEWLPRFRPITKKYLESVSSALPKSDVFYFDRLSPAILDAAQKYYNEGSIIVFEPSSTKDERLFKKAVSLSHIIKFSEERISNYDQLYPFCQATIEIKTLGSHGVSFRLKQFGDEWHTELPFALDNVLDSAGAGDWCTSGIIHSLISASNNFNTISLEDAKQAITLGQALGAINCLFQGARGIMYSLTRTQLEELVKALLYFRQSSDSIIPSKFPFQINHIDKEQETSLIRYEELLEIY